MTILQVAGLQLRSDIFRIGHTNPAIFLVLAWTAGVCLEVQSITVCLCVVLLSNMIQHTGIVEVYVYHHIGM